MATSGPRDATSVADIPGGELPGDLRHLIGGQRSAAAGVRSDGSGVTNQHVVAPASSDGLRVGVAQRRADRHCDLVDALDDAAHGGQVIVEFGELLAAVMSVDGQRLTAGREQPADGAQLHASTA